MGWAAAESEDEVRHETRVELKALANAIADELLAALKARTIPKIGIDEIRAAIAAKLADRRFERALEGDPHLGFRDAVGALEEFTTRRVVEKV